MLVYAAPEDASLQCADCGAHLGLGPGQVGQASGDRTAEGPCPECGGIRLFRSQPGATQPDMAAPGGLTRNMVDMQAGGIDRGGNPLGEGTITAAVMTPCPNCQVPSANEHICTNCGTVLHDIQTHNPDVTRDVAGDPQSSGTINGGEYRSPAFETGRHDDSFPASGTFSNRTVPVTERVERMSTLNMEPYAPLWDESYIPKQAGNPLEMGLALAAPFDQEIPGLGEASDASAAGELKNVAGDVMGKVFGGGQTAPVPQGPAAPASMSQIASTDDILMTLVADYETPMSVPSVDEQHDDPEHQDQMEFNDGDQSPSNFMNPNLQDSGAGGEDGVKEATPGYGFSPNSPAIEHMEQLKPLLMHYLENGGGGQNDPRIRALHEMLDSENPGYLDQKHPQGEEIVQQMLQHHKDPHGIQHDVLARVAIQAPLQPMPSGLPAAPTPAPAGTVQQMGMAGAEPYLQPGQAQPQQMQQQQASCPTCGGGMVNGQCATCGMGGQNQNPYQGHVANSVGPVTPEQKAAVEQLLIERGRVAEIPNVELHPEQYAKEMAEISQNPNVAPLVDPSQQQAAPMPPPPSPGGGMPPGMVDPSQMGGGQAQMQPMSHKADANNRVPRCPACNSASTSLMDGNDGDGMKAGKCHSCFHEWMLDEALNNKKKSRAVWAEVPNPLLQPPQVHEPQSSLTWKDERGEPIQEGQIYDLHASGFAVPDRVKVTYKHPNEIGLKLVGEFDNTGTDGSTEPDIKVTSEQAKQGKYTFALATGDADKQAPEPNGGMPGLEQIPQQPQTTDEYDSNSSNPNAPDSYTSSVAASLLDDQDDDEVCHRCGYNSIDHTYASTNTILHECRRCMAAWESRDDFQGVEAGTDLSWVLESDNPDDDFDYERHKAMREANRGSQSRSLSDVVAKDRRYQQVHEILSENARTAGRRFTPGEQRDLINERGSARNSDLLDLENTHYVLRNDYTGKANGDNVPDSHVLLGL